MPLQHDVAMRILNYLDAANDLLVTMDASLNVIEIPVDTLEGYMKIIDVEHHHIHEGVEWQYDHMFLSVAADGFARLRVFNNDGKQFHVQFFVNAEAKVYVKSYIGTVYSNDGTLVTPWNRSTCSTEVTPALVYHTPTIQTQGSLRVNSMAGFGQGSGQVGGESSNRVESIICTGKDILVEAQNKSTTAKDIGISIRWYEIPEGT